VFPPYRVGGPACLTGLASSPIDSAPGSRPRSARRPAGYHDAERSAAELWNGEVGLPVAGGWPVLEVDTGVAVDVAALARRIRTATSLP
jgi:hypothetical protein